MRGGSYHHSQPHTNSHTFKRKQNTQKNKKHHPETGSSGLRTFRKAPSYPGVRQEPSRLGDLQSGTRTPQQQPLLSGRLVHRSTDISLLEWLSKAWSAVFISLLPPRSLGKKSHLCWWRVVFCYPFFKIDIGLRRKLNKVIAHLGCWSEQVVSIGLGWSPHGGQRT